MSAQMRSGWSKARGRSTSVRSACSGSASSQGEPVGELGVQFTQQPPERRPTSASTRSASSTRGRAAKSELEVGDVITSIDGIDVTGENSGQAWPLMRLHRAQAPLGLARNATVTVTLAAP
jgi:C-terminal processing protease CtpA/Prc